MKTLTITLNASVDTTYTLNELQTGATNRILDKRAVPGGKGNNVARVLSRLGHAVIASGFIGGGPGHVIDQGLRREGIETSFVTVAGESRTSLAVLERSSGQVTEILEPGPEVSPDEAQRFLAHLWGLASGVDRAVISGSLPQGLPADYYAEVVRALRRAGVPTVLDSSGDPMRLALTQQPDVIKPNVDEMAFLMGGRHDVAEMIAYARRELIGPLLAPDATVLLSLGADGAALIRSDSVHRARPPRVQVASPVGCGDAMVAGYLDALSRNEDGWPALRRAVAAGTAAALHDAPGVVDPNDIQRLSKAVERLS